MEKVKDLFKKLGLKEDVINDFLAEGDSSTLSADLMRDNVVNAQREVLKNDTAFVKGIKDQFVASFMASKEKVVMEKFGVTKEEYDALPENNKFNELINFAETKTKAASADPDKDATIQTQTQTIAELNSKISEYDTKIIPEIEGKVDARLKGIAKDSLINKITNDIAVTTKSIEDAREFALYKMEKQYNIVLDEKGENVEIRDKNDVNMKVYKDSNPVTFVDAYTETLKENGMLKQSNADDSDLTPPPTPPAAPKKNIPAYLRGSVEAAAKANSQQ